jgi:hypothetical protein
LFVELITKLFPQVCKNISQWRRRRRRRRKANAEAGSYLKYSWMFLYEHIALSMWYMIMHTRLTHWKVCAKSNEESSWRFSKLYKLSNASMIFQITNPMNSKFMISWHCNYGCQLGFKLWSDDDILLKNLDTAVVAVGTMEEEELYSENSSDQNIWSWFSWGWRCGEAPDQ